ncbi:rod-binding protein [Litorivicinus sp.]|nr:rod-binding protein [Litorivicinus sp.]MDC1088048.1 rod-binding protein [Litorivicinus sp.]
MNAADDIKSTYDFKGLGELKAQAARDQTDDATVQKTASQFEAMFLQMMLKSMRATVPDGGLLNSSGTETFEQMLDQHVAMAMAGRRSTGLSQMVEKFIRQSQNQVSDDIQQQSFSLDNDQSIALPLVKQSDEFPISRGTTQQFLLNRSRLGLGGLE